MLYLSVYIKKDNEWYFIERGPDGRTAENGTVKKFDFAGRLMEADVIDWNRAMTYSLDSNPDFVSSEE